MHFYTPKTMERAMKIQEVILRAISGQILWLQAAQILGMSTRQMRRLKNRYKHYGYDGLFDRRRKIPSPRRIPLVLAEKVLRLYREKYFDFNAKHFCYKLSTKHNIKISYNWVRLALQGAGLMRSRKNGSRHRLRRPRKPLIGMMLHIDGSPHDWLGDGTFYDLVSLCDDANNEVYAMALVNEEDTASCMALIREIVEKKGIFCSLYSDRASHFFITRRAGDDVLKYRHTQIARALKELGIQPIPAYSPQARGRSERLNQTHQGRLPQELRLRGIKTLQSANKFIRTKYIKEHNKQFKCQPEQPGSAFLSVPPSVNLDKVFCCKHERTVNKDNTVSFNNRILQIGQSALRVSFARCKVIVYEHLDKSVTLSFGPHELGYYLPKGNDEYALSKNKRTKCKNILLTV